MQPIVRSEQRLPRRLPTIHLPRYRQMNHTLFHNGMLRLWATRHGKTVATVPILGKTRMHYKNLFNLLGKHIGGSANDAPSPDTMRRRLADQDGSGKVDVDEFLESARSCGLEFTRDQVHDGTDRIPFRHNFLRRSSGSRYDIVVRPSGRGHARFQRIPELDGPGRWVAIRKRFARLPVHTASRLRGITQSCRRGPPSPTSC